MAARLAGGWRRRVPSGPRRRFWQHQNRTEWRRFIPALTLKKEREKLHEMTDHRQCFKPIPELIEGRNRHLKGWKNYFDLGYPRVAFGEINTYVRDRLTQHLRRRSQRPFRPPEGVSYYEQIQRFGRSCPCRSRWLSSASIANLGRPTEVVKDFETPAGIVY